MKKLVILLAVVVFSGAAFAGQTYLETFDADEAGWQVANQNLNTFDATHSSNGGNGGGYISAYLPDAGATNRYVTFQATKSIVGSGDTVSSFWGLAVGNRFTADFKVAGGDVYDSKGSSENARVRFYIGSSSGTYWTTKDNFSWNPNDDTEWTTHQVSLIESNFRRVLGNDSFANSLESTVDLGLQFGASVNESFPPLGNLGFTGDATLMLDNFGTVVPAPGAILLGSLGVGMVSYLKRRRSL